MIFEKKPTRHLLLVVQPLSIVLFDRACVERAQQIRGDTLKQPDDERTMTEAREKEEKTGKDDEKTKNDAEFFFLANNEEKKVLSLSLFSLSFFFLSRRQLQKHSFLLNPDQLDIKHQRRVPRDRTTHSR